MKKRNLMKNVILISLSIIILMIGNQKVAHAQWVSNDPVEKSNPNTGLIIAGVAVTIAITVIIIVIVKKNKKKKSFSYNFNNNMENYQMARFALPTSLQIEADEELQMQKALIQLEPSTFFNSSAFTINDNTGFKTGAERWRNSLLTNISIKH